MSKFNANCSNCRFRDNDCACLTSVGGIPAGWQPRTKAQMLEDSFIPENKKLVGDISGGYQYVDTDTAKRYDTMVDAARFAINQKFGTWKEGVKMDEKMNINALYPAYTAYNNMYKSKTNKQKILEDVKNVIFNDPATIVYWKDGTKTVVKAEGEKFDPEKGLAMAIAKKHFGNEGTYYELFKKWLPKKEADDAITEFLTAKQLAEGTGQSVKSVQRDCRKGLYPGAKKVDGKWLIPLLGLVGGNKK